MGNQNRVKTLRENKFRKKLEDLLNCESMENESDTPDFILAQFLESCLFAFDSAVRRRREWWGPKEKTDKL